jgi:hypothetical protein
MSNNNIQPLNDPMLDPRVKVTNTRREYNGSEDDKIVKFYLDSAGKKLEQPMCEHLGSVALHFYKNSITNGVDFITQNQVTGISEQICAAGIQQMMLAMMENFGVQRPRSLK